MNIAGRATAMVADGGNIRAGREASAPAGLIALAGLGWKAWVQERAADAEVRLLHAQQRRINARRSVAEAELAAEHLFAQARLYSRTSLALAEQDARLRIAQAALQAEEAEAECAFRRRIRATSSEQAREIVGASVETERLLLERERLRHQRLAGNVAPAPEASPPAAALAPAAPPAPAPAIEAHVSDRQIESLALRAISRFGSLAPDEAERAWTQWEEELARRLPPYAAREVAHRVQEMRGMAR